MKPMGYLRTDMIQAREFQTAIAEVIRNFGSDVVITAKIGEGYDAALGKVTSTGTQTTTVKGFFHKS